ncbi:hypothetical protein RVY52_006845 [Burkholderia cenocepacia]|nr:hypothetical protein [Burkholderia cenocepacia]
MSIRLSIAAAFDARAGTDEQVVAPPDRDTTQRSLGNPVVDRGPARRRGFPTRLEERDDDFALLYPNEFNIGA